MSDWVKVEILAKVASISQHVVVHITLFLIEIVVAIRTTPYLPNLSKTPAKIMEPEVLASTWAFGSQKCPPKIGILIKNGNIKATDIIVPVFTVVFGQNKIASCILMIIIK